MSTVDDLMWNTGCLLKTEPTAELRDMFNTTLMQHDRDNYYKRYAEREMEKVELWNKMRAAIMRSGDKHWIERVEKAERGESLQGGVR